MGMDSWDISSYSHSRDFSAQDGLRSLISVRISCDRLGFGSKKSISFETVSNSTYNSSGKVCDRIIEFES